MGFALYINPIVISGGLVFWWSREMNVCIMGKYRNFIDCKVSSGPLGGDCLITWVYDDPDFTKRRIGLNRRDAWLCVGGFNDISHHREKIRDRRKEQRSAYKWTILVSII